MPTMPIEEEDEIQPNPNPLSDLEPAELVQPTINIQTQFNTYNKKYFSNKIVNTTVEYSTRMTLCAGTCTFRPPNIRIALSEPLLKFRSRSDLLSTLLHEMIHAYLFLTERLARDGPDGHGPMFMSHAHRINTVERAVHITPYHTFNAEVDHYRVHHWRCQKCAHLIKRSMNRAPAPADHFWSAHQQNCGGQYIKIAGPPKKEKSIKPPKNRALAVHPNANGALPKGVMKTFRIDHMLSGRVQKPQLNLVNCPVCDITVKQHDMNSHLDLCLAESVCTQPPNSPQCQENRLPRPEENSAVEIKTNDSPKPVPNPQPARLSERHILPTPQKPCRPVNSYPTTSPKTYDVMQYIADPEALYNLALAPKKFPAEQVDKIFGDPPPSFAEPSHQIPKTGIKDFLHSLIHPESPSSRELRAKAIIDPLRFGPNDEEFSFQALSKHLSVSWLELQRLNQQNSSTDESGNIVFAAQVLDMLSLPQRKPKHTETNVAPKRARTDTALVQQTISEVLPKRTRVSVVTPIRSGASDGTCVEANGRLQSEHKKPKMQAREVTKCPICNIDVAQAGLDEHISICVTGSQEEEDHIKETPPHKPEKVTTNLKAATQRESRLSDTTSDKGQRCPICDVALSRKDLKTHVASCMMTTGLADAF